MKVIVVALAILATYFIWRFVVRGDALVLTVPNSGKRVAATVKRVIPDKEIVIEVDNNEDKNRITQITILRSLVAEWGMSSPAEFKEEPLTLTEEEKKDKEEVAFVEKVNKEEMRWVGNVPLALNAKTELVFPVKTAQKLSGIIRIRYEKKLGLGGVISSLKVDLAGQEVNKEPKQTDSTQGTQ